MTAHTQRRYAILAPGVFTTRAAKTAHGVIAYAEDQTVVVIDPSLAGKTVAQALPYLQASIPIVANVQEAQKYRPTSLLIGVAPPGGALPQSWRKEIINALESGLEIVSGLHDILADDPEFAGAAQRGKSSLWDVRVAPECPIFSGAAWKIDPFVLLTVGSDCSVGKMTVSLELTKAAQARGRQTEFIATGQTGVMIAGRGISIDRVIADFAPGAIESLMIAHKPTSDLLIVEGQGGINHPAYAPVTLALLYGSAPDALILVHDIGRKTIQGYETPLLGYRELITLYESLTAAVKPACIIGIALNTSSVTEIEAKEAIATAQAETGLPAADVVRFGPHDFYDAIASRLHAKNTPRTTR